MPSRASEQQQQRGAATSTTTTTTMTFNDLNSLHPEHRIIANAKNHSPLPSSLRGQGEFDKDKSLRMTTATTTTQSQQCPTRRIFFCYPAPHLALARRSLPTITISVREIHTIMDDANANWSRS
jgi:hypothetical protein